MSTKREATHTHKRSGRVAILESSTELAKVSVIDTGEEYWVKVIDLTPVKLIDLPAVPAALLNGKPVRSKAIKAK